MLATLPALADNPRVTEVAPGIYRPSSILGLDVDLRAAGFSVEKYPAHRLWATVGQYQPGTPERDAAYAAALDAPADYGVCDDPSQITALWPGITTSPGQFVIGAIVVRRQDQDPVDGWRWSKWGPYIGVREQTSDYLADEAAIESVWLFHIYEVLAGPGIN